MGVRELEESEVLVKQRCYSSGVKHAPNAEDPAPCCCCCLIPAREHSKRDGGLVPSTLVGGGGIISGYAGVSCTDTGWACSLDALGLPVDTPDRDSWVTFYSSNSRYGWPFLFVSTIESTINQCRCIIQIRRE